MKRTLAFLLLCLVVVAWWATTSRQSGPVPPADGGNTPAPYPADFEQRLTRVVGMRLELHAPLPAAPIPWQTACDHPAAGHAAARKGGRVRLSNAGPFPAHFLAFGGTTAQFFHQNLRAATEIPLVAAHPRTRQTTAGVAEAWACEDRSIWFRLNPEARYTNGRPIRAGDYLLAILLQYEQRCPEFQALAEIAESLCAHGDTLLSLRLKSPVSITTAAQLLHAAEPGFYQHFDSRFRETYAQRIPPATGAYQVSSITRGRCICLQRIPSWWGEQLPLCRNRFNADTLEYHFLTDEAQVWEYFLAGRLDALQTRNVAAWQQRMDDIAHLPTLVYDAEYPLPPYGIALNTRTLPDRELRRGLLHAMNMRLAIEHMWRGEGQQLPTFHTGYADLTPTSTPQYQYAPETARACFARAGYTRQGSDGILRNSQDKRLSVRLLYSPNEKISTMVAHLIRSAAFCGAEIIAEPQPWQTCQRQIQERRHQLVFWAIPAPEAPTPARFFASHADPQESPFGLQSAAMDAAIARFEQAPAAETLSAVDTLVYKEAIWLPGWKENRVFLVHHPWLRIPPSPWCYDAADAHIFWVHPAEP